MIIFIKRTFLWNGDLFAIFMIASHVSPVFAIIFLLYVSMSFCITNKQKNYYVKEVGYRQLSNKMS